MSEKRLKIGLVGATGLVGQTFLDVLSQRMQPRIEELRLFASLNSAGRKLKFGNKRIGVGVLHDRALDGLDCVFFSGGDDLSELWGPKAVEKGVWVIDNSATFRLHPDVLLIVPEVNGHLLDRQKKPQIIANPNCTTIQLVVVLKALMPLGLQSVTIASYQAASGAGRDARDELVKHSRIKQPPIDSRYFARSLAFNVVPQIGGLDESGFSSEELKVMKETKKILATPELKVSAFTVRVPVVNAHSEAVWVRFHKSVSRDEVLSALMKQEGLVTFPEVKRVVGLTPREISGEDFVFVGRIHQDLDDPQTFLFWIVADNLRKGAALNGVQILERLLN